MKERPLIHAPIMKDPELERQLNIDGVVVMRDFLDKNAVKELFDYNTANQPEFTHNSIINSVWHSHDQEYKARTIEKIIDIYTPFCEKYFDNYNIFGGSFVIKLPNGGGVSCPHVDFGIVNEEVYRSFNLWIPLVPTTDDNGALKVLKGSHRMKQLFRGPNIPDQTVDIRDWLWQNMETYELNPGDAILYDHRAIHGSNPNNTEIPRVATSCAMTNAGAEMVLYFWDETKRAVVGYVTEPEYLLTHNHEQLPTDLEIVGEWGYSLDQVTLNDLGIIPAPTGLFDRLMALIR
ncbi:MAG: hypothetical protein GC178_03445 [Flavobacteriales bacterium]|nr:hypothetical protein [Flavobacteriales bacterium]